MSTPSETQHLFQALSPIAADLVQLEPRLRQWVPTQSAIAKKIVDQVFSASGKRIRPALYFLCCKMLGYDGPHLLEIGAVCEYVHTASLLHDDVIDNSSLRRNQPTANSIWGDASAVLVGDLIYSRASEMMAQTGNLDVVETFACAIRVMSEGELTQLENAFKFELSREVYEEILYGKTGVLIGASCKAAGYLANIAPDLIHHLGTFGEKLGIAFQMLDDALDYQGKQSVFGKATLADLGEGRITLPILILRDLLDDNDRQTLKRIVTSENITEKDLTWIHQAIERTGAATLTLEKASAMTQEALSHLTDNFPNTPERQHLEGLAIQLLSRIQ